MSLALLVLSALSGLCWGTGDFLGGLQSRRIPALAVTLWSQLTGGVLLLAVTVFTGQRPVLTGILWGVAGGVFGGMALLSFYRGLAVGAMSIVAPVSACGAVVPVAVSVVTGHAPHLLAGLGIGICLVGIVVVSIYPEAEVHPAGRPNLSLGLALLAALGFGLFYVFLHAGGSSSGLWPVVGVRIGSLTLVLVLVLGGRQPAPFPGRRLPLVMVVGVLDTTANGLWFYAATHGNLGIAAVLGSLYPVATVLLSSVVLKERLTLLQGSGVLLALAGVALVGE
ncbi:MAG: DMT family transporter [Chloroflexota bacterium]